MKITQSMICLDCDEISVIMTHCPVCKSRSVVLLATWFPPKDAARETLGKTENLMAEIGRLKRSMIEMCADLETDDEPIGACV